MLHVQQNSHSMPETEPRSHDRYKSVIVTAVIFSLVIGLVAGYGAGTVVTGSNDAYARAHESLTSSFLVSGNVTIGSLEIPRGISFASNGNPESSMVLSGDGSYHYDVYLQHFTTYSVTIFYQDSLGNWRQCLSKDGNFHPIGSGISDNFSCYFHASSETMDEVVHYAIMFHLE